MTLLGIDSALVLSPMVDVTDAAFRSLAKDWGADVTCSEMVSAAGLVHGNEDAWRHVTPWPQEHPYGIQFMTGDPDEMRRAVLALEGRIQPDFVDVNLGCPAPNILRSCAGGFLLQDPPRAGAVVAAAREAADQIGIPHVSAKLRTGPDAAHLTYLDVGQACEDAGVSWLTLHGRTVAQGYQGQADWDAIASLVRHAGVPVIGNGDLRTPADVVRMRESTGCAGFFIARAAMHDPTVFRRMRQALQGGRPDPAPPLDDRLRLALEYIDRAEQVDIVHPSTLRRQVMRFAAGAPGAKALRLALHDARDREAIMAAVTAARRG